MPEAEIRPVTPFPASGGDEPPLTVLSDGDAFSGRLEMKGDGHLMGSFEGEIRCAGELLVGPEARVNANVEAARITVSGTVVGNVVARGRLKITATGQVRGDAEVASLVVQEGGVHFGLLRVHPEGVPEPEEPPALEERAAAPAAGEAEGGSGLERLRRIWKEVF